MLDTIPVPAQSKFGAAVARRLNSLRPIAPAGSLAMSGPTGTGFAPLPANLRDRRGGTAADKSCFRIESRSVGAEDGEEGESEIHRFLVDCYYNVGGILKKTGDIDIEALIPIMDEETSEGGSELNTVIYFEQNDEEVSAGSCTLAELVELQENAGKYVFALYLFSANGTLLTDLRTAPQIQMVEVLQ